MHIVLDESAMAAAGQGDVLASCLLAVEPGGRLMTGRRREGGHDVGDVGGVGERFGGRLFSQPCEVAVSAVEYGPVEGAG